jgi:hypothetical protein
MKVWRYKKGYCVNGIDMAHNIKRTVPLILYLFILIWIHSKSQDLGFHF